MRLGLLFFFALIFSAQAEVIKTKQHFQTYGRTDSFSWAPARYKTDFRYDVFYYIPDSIKNSSQVKSLIFLHGGGDSTLTRDGAIAAVNLYINDLKKIADRLGFVLIMPSSNGLNWGAHTRGMLRDLATMMRAELDVDSNLIGVSGHSMGGMGITRNYQYGADEFAFYLPMSSGIDTTSTWQWNDEFLYKVFNVPYIQLQGKQDAFTIFVQRDRDHLARILQLEEKYKVKSKFDVIFYDGTHKPNYPLMVDTLKSLYAKPRDFYQPRLWGSFYTGDTTRVENNIPTNYDSESRYFWLELTGIDLSQPETTNVQAQIVGQTIQITLPVIPKQSKMMRVYLSQKMIDLNQKIDVVINGAIVGTRQPTPANAQNLDARDPAFIFDGVIDVPFDIAI